MTNMTPDSIASSRFPREPGPFARRLRGTGVAGVIIILVVIGATVVGGPLLGGVVVLLWAWYTKLPWRDLGFIRPKRWAVTVIGGIVAGVAFKLLMKAVVMRLLGAPDINARYHYLAHNTAALPGMLLMVIVSAGFAEEIIARGFFFERLERLLGRSRAARVAIVLVTSALFALAHLRDQHWPGATQAFILGLVVGTYFAIRRNLWTLIVWHMAFDICAVFLVYFDLETTVARAIFH